MKQKYEFNKGALIGVVSGAIAWLIHSYKVANISGYTPRILFLGQINFLQGFLLLASIGMIIGWGIQYLWEKFK